MRSRHIELLILTGALVLFGCASPAPESETEPEPAATPKQDAQVKILQFYASPSIVNRGESTLICYGVSDAKEVHINPPVEDLWPAYSRCFSVTPSEHTTYRLTATGPGGPVTKELEIEVQGQAGFGGRSLIQLFSASETRVPAGSRVTLCYSLDGDDTTATLDPPVQKLSGKSRCFTVALEQTTTFTLRASGDNRNEEKQLTVSTE